MNDRRPSVMLKRAVRYLFSCSSLFILCLIPNTAMAHLVNADVGVFYAGMMHPITSAEHLLPTLAVAVLASQMGKQAARRVLLLFPLTLAVGVLIGAYFPQVAFVQQINLLLLVVLGGLLIAAESVPSAAAPVLAVCTGLILGYRSGVDMASAAVGIQFIPGVALTGLIITALCAAWVPEDSSRNARLGRGIFGAVLGITGIVLLIFPMAGLDLQSIRSVNLPGQEEIVRSIKSKELSAAVVFAALTGSLIWGAGHALTPGHGKAIVAAYLVGARGTPWHAVSLGLMVTMTHTLVVFALGFITLVASRYVLPEQLYPWLGLISGMIVTGMGGTMAVSRFRRLKQCGMHGHHHHHGHFSVHGHDHDHFDHDHTGGHDDSHGHGAQVHSHDPHHDHAHADTHSDHEHDHHHGHEHSHSDYDHDNHHGHGHSNIPSGSDDSPVAWRALLGLGISGGLLPCPAALVLLLTAISLGRVGFGMILVTVFSLGLAGVLIAVGLLFIKGGRLLARIPHVSGFSHWLPVFSALVVFGIGVLVTLQAAAKI